MPNNQTPQNLPVNTAAGKALEKVLVWIMYTAIVGSAVYFYTRLQSIENNITQHHGVNWAEITNIVEISQIQKEAAEVKVTLETEISENINTIADISAKLVRIDKWIAHNDLIMSALNNNRYSANVLYDDFGGNDALCKVNRAHLDGGNFKINDQVSITNESSQIEETIICTISSIINDKSEGSVLYTLNATAARNLSFTKSMGRILISTNHIEIPEDRRWKKISEFE